MSRPNWRKIADQLAERLMHQTGRCSDPDGPHDPAECPFCADDAAYQAYVEAGGTVRITSFNRPVYVNLTDVKANWPE